MDDQHRFWDTQPVVKDSANVKSATNHQIETKTPGEISTTPLSLLNQFEWSEVDIFKDSDLDDLHSLLSENYVEDPNSVFRLDYSKEFLRWALGPPGYEPGWHLSVRVKENGKMCAFISAIPVKIMVHHKEVNMVEINFLCIHKKLRSKRLAPVLIKEITRRTWKECKWDAAIYTAAMDLPNKVSSCRYYHRMFNLRKLIDIGFFSLPSNLKLTTLQKSWRLPSTPRIEGLRLMTPEDIPQCCKLLQEYLSRYKLYPVFNEEDFAHWFAGPVRCYVVGPEGNPEGITDFFSFYLLDTKIIDNPKHSELKAAYSFYNVSNKIPMKELLFNAFIVAKGLGVDLFNAFDLGENREVLNELKFAQGNGVSNYYLYNWECKYIHPGELGLVIV